MDSVKRLFCGVIRLRRIKDTTETKLLTLDQILSSASNATIVVAGAWLMTSDDLSRLAIVQLFVVSLMAVNRSLILEPAMTLSGPRQRLHVGWRHVSASMLLSAFALAFLSAGSFIGEDVPLSTPMLLLVMLQDALRYRALSGERTVLLLLSDGLGLLTLCLLLMIARPSSIGEVLLAWGISVIPGVLLLAHRSSGAVASIRGSLRLGSFQTLDNLMGMSTYLMPMFVAQYLGSSAGLSAFRIAQTFMGPLSSLTTAVILSQLRVAHELKARASIDVLLECHRVGRRLRTITACYGLVILFLGALYSTTVDSVVRSHLVYALPLTVLVSVVGGPAAADVASLRALALQKASVVPRLGVLVVTGTALMVSAAAGPPLFADPLWLPVAVTPIAGLIAWRLAARSLLANRQEEGRIKCVVEVTEQEDSRPLSR